MLGADSSGPIHVRGRISVVPGGQDSPAGIGVPRPPRPCAVKGPAITTAAPKPTAINTARMFSPELRMREAVQSRRGLQPHAAADRVNESDPRLQDACCLRAARALLVLPDEIGRA